MWVARALGWPLVITLRTMCVARADGVPLVMVFLTTWVTRSAIAYTSL